MKQGVLILLIAILIIPLSSALQISLIEPHTGAWLYSSTVIFKCQINPEGGYVDTVRLFTNIGGSWSQTGTVFNNPNPASVFNATFSVQSIPNGNYLWNCLANSQYSNINSSFTISTPENQAPVFTGVISNQTWDQNTQKNNAFDLDTYFSDPESSALVYSTIDADGTIVISRDSSNVISFSQPSGWWGTDKIRFRACDTGGKCTDSNEITLTVNQISQTNTNPTISGVSDMAKVVGDDWTIGLNSKISDAEDSDDKLNISVSGVDTSIFTVSVNDELNELAFEAVDEGTDSFTITVADTKGATASQTVTVSIEEQSSSSNEEEPSSEFAEEFSVEITAAVPDENKKVSLKPGQSQKFEITLNEDADIEWKVDGIKVQTDSKSYTYIPKAADIGSHTVDVIAGLGTDKDMKTWTIEVAGEQNKTVNLCGNKKVDANETCLTCPADVVCKEGEYCNEGVCKQTKSNLVTGYAAVAKDFIVQEWYYPTLGFGIILLLIIASKIIRMNKKVKRESVSDYLAEFSEKKTRWGRIRERLREWDKMRQLRKKNRQNLKILEKEKKSKISINAPGIESIVSFVNQKTQEGNSKREIKKALKSKGWSRKQIKLAFKKIKYDSRKSA